MSTQTSDDRCINANRKKSGADSATIAFHGPRFAAARMSRRRASTSDTAKHTLSAGGAARPREIRSRCLVAVARTGVLLSNDIGGAPISKKNILRIRSRTRSATPTRKGQDAARQERIACRYSVCPTRRPVASGRSLVRRTCRRLAEKFVFEVSNKAQRRAPRHAPAQYSPCDAYSCLDVSLSAAPLPAERARFQRQPDGRPGNVDLCLKPATRLAQPARDARNDGMRRRRLVR